MVLYRLTLGMGRRQSLFCSLRLPHNLDPSRGTLKASVLPQLLCAPRAAYLAGLHTCPRRLLPESRLVRRRPSFDRNQDRSLVDLRSLSPEPIPSNSSVRGRTHLVSSHRRAVLLPLGSYHSRPSAALDARHVSDRRTHCLSDLPP